MPNIKSLAQMRLMQAAKRGKVKGISPAVAAEVIGPKGTHYGKLPTRVKKTKGRKSR